MRRGRSADRRQDDQADPHVSQASHEKQPEDLPHPSNPNEVVGTLIALIREKPRTQAEQARIQYEMARAYD